MDPTEKGQPGLASYYTERARPPGCGWAPGWPESTASAPAMWCASGAQRLPADRSAYTPTVVATVVPARSPCSPWLPVVDLDVQRLADKIISRC